jgi:hypothetical protein
LLNRLLNLKAAKDRKGMAPNKPLLVLAILDLAEHGVRPHLLASAPNNG